MKTVDYPVWLAVLPDQRAAARADAGAHPDGHNAISWDKEAQLWFARPGADLSRLQKWMPDRSIRSSGGGDPQSEFFDALTSAGLVLDGLPVMDGKRYRVPVVDGKKGNRDGVYRGFLDGVKPGGWYINYHRADNDKDITRWKASGSTAKADPLARVHIRAVMRQSQDDSAREQAALYAQQTIKAQALYKKLPAADPAHGYLERKGITVADDVRQTRNGALVVPFHDADGVFRTLQYIPPDGEKYLFKDAPKAGHFRVEGGELRNGDPILYAEGYATARSLYMVTGRPIVMTIDAGNMETVASVLKLRYPDSPHMFMADVDHSKEKNKGVLSANRAAAATGGLVLLPDLSAAEIEQGFTDFNDLHLSRGAEQLRETLLPDIVQALEQLNYKDASMATPDDVQSAADNIPAVSPDAMPDTTSARRQGAAQEKTDVILKLRDEGLTPAQIAKELSIGQTSVYRILKAQQSQAEASSAIPEPAASSATPEPVAPSAIPEPAASSAAQEPEPTASIVAGVKDWLAASSAAERETITLYHGSPSTFSAIDPDKIGLGQNFMGHGFYTDDAVVGVHYAMDEINHRDYHVYELEIPSRSVILDRWDSSSLTDELREKIREAGKKVDQQLTEQGLTSRLGIGDLLAGCEKIDEPFFRYADSPEGARILKEAGIDALKDNSYIAIINTDLIDNVRLRSAEGALRNEMVQYVENALGSSVQDSSTLSSILQDNPDYSIYYHAIRSELVKLAEAQNRPAEAERLTSLLRHTLIETIDSKPDRKANITPLNRLYAEAIRSLDLNHDDSAVTLGHLIDNAVININPNQKRVVDTDKPESVAPEHVVVTLDIPASEVSSTVPLVASDVTPAPASVITPAPEPAAVQPDINIPQPEPQVTAPETISVPAPSGPYDGYMGLYGTGAELRDRLAALTTGETSPAALLKDINSLRVRVDSAGINSVYSREHMKEMQQVFNRLTQGVIAGADVMDKGAVSRLRSLIGQRDTWNSLHPTSGSLDVNTIPEKVSQQYALLTRGDITRAQFDREVRMLYGEFTRAEPEHFTGSGHADTRAVFERMAALQSPERAAQFTAAAAVSMTQLPPASAEDLNSAALYRIQNELRDGFVSLAHGESSSSMLTENVARLQAKLDEAKAQGVYSESHLNEIQGAFDRVTQNGLAGMSAPDSAAPGGDFASRYPASASLDVASVPARVEAQYAMLIRGDVSRAQFEENLAILRNEVVRQAENGRVSTEALAAAEGVFANLSAFSANATASDTIPQPAVAEAPPVTEAQPGAAHAATAAQPAMPSESAPVAVAPETADVTSEVAVSAAPAVTQDLSPVESAAQPANSAEPKISAPMPDTTATAPESEPVQASAVHDAIPSDQTAPHAAVPPEVRDKSEAESRAEPASTPDSAATPLATAFGEENGILLGARRVAPQPEDTPAANTPRTDQDKLLSRVSHEDHPDGKSVIYRLDSEPAFIDRGNRLVMAEGASTHEEKVLAALLTAAKFYHGKIELTGSDEFKAFAIGVIVNNGLQVSMKNPSQQLALDEAKRAAGQPVAAPDAVRGDPVAPVTASAPTEASTAPPVTPAAAAPVMAEAPASGDMTPAQAPEFSSPVNPEKPAIRPDIHTPAEKAREPVTGKVTACGQAPFRFEKDGDESTFITLRTREGAQTFWGKELAGLMRETRLREGQMVTLQWMGKQPVTVNKPVKDTQGNFTGHYEPIQTKRNQWALTSARGDRVQTGGDEMLKLSAFSANRYTQVQHALVSQLGISIDAPPKPADGLFWIRPDGQGSVSTGDALSAQRPPHNENAGKPVMTAWGADGQPDLYLVQGDGHYLQGVVRQNDSYQHVLVSLPDSKEAPRMVINLLTPDGAQPIGSGNGINRSDGKPVPREHVVFRVTGDEKQRIAKLHEPASIPPALHARLGYDERYKAETVYPKEQPAAAPQAAPVTPPRPAQ